MSQQYRVDTSKISLNKLRSNWLQAPLPSKAVYLSLWCAIYSPQTACSFLGYSHFLGTYFLWPLRSRLLAIRTALAITAAADWFQAVLWPFPHCKTAAAMSSYEEELTDCWKEGGAGGHQQYYLSSRISVALEKRAAGNQLSDNLLKVVRDWDPPGSWHMHCILELDMHRTSSLPADRLYLNVTYLHVTSATAEWLMKMTLSHYQKLCGPLSNRWALLI